MSWKCLRCNFDNEFRKLTIEENEKSKMAIKMNPYAKDLPKGLKDVWCDNCKAHNTLVDEKVILCSGGKIFYKKFALSREGKQ